ncbi:lipopolysaccharide export LptBFGC system permease protein LptF [Flavobacterium sp. 7E]|uniref:hypothetical protein n=1 Tax=Flavobacterium sp. 7E TaxID=2735898 RepID=UPI0015706AF9|nr:hypothetical protein [Flavobacterium sp. 7E]NRS90335.1 lipopolysaccharide export LptBFGC system permease protein LptF [Flavobacterium sp. 7E]
MKIILTFIFFILIISCSSIKRKQSSVNIPQIESNYDSIDFVGHTNKILIKFSKDKDFVFASSSIGFWGGYNKRYELISLKKGVWSSYKYNGSKKYGKKILFITFWKRDSIANGKFKLIKKEISNQGMQEFFNYMDENAMWSLNQDSINLITDKPKHYTADSATPVIDIISKKQKKSLSIRPNTISYTIHREKFRDMYMFFSNWKFNYCE